MIASHYNFDEIYWATGFKCMKTYCRFILTIIYATPILDLSEFLFNIILDFVILSNP